MIKLKHSKVLIVESKTNWILTYWHGNNEMNRFLESIGCSLTNKEYRKLMEGETVFAEVENKDKTETKKIYFQ